MEKVHGRRRVSIVIYMHAHAIAFVEMVRLV